MDRFKIADALSGFSAGVAGRLPQHQVTQMQLSKERKRALAEDANEAYMLLQADPTKAADFLKERVKHIARLRGDPKDTLGVIQQIESGDIEGAARDLSIVVQAARQAGYLPELEPVGASQITSGGQVVMPDGQGGFNAKTVRGFDVDAMKKANSQFGGQVTVKDSKGNLFFATTRRDPQTGNVETVMAPFNPDIAAPEGKVTVTGSYGLTPQEKIEQTAAEKEASTGAQEISNYKKAGVEARAMIPRTQQMIDILSRVETGGINAVKKEVASFFNLDSEDAVNLGLLNSMLGKLVLSQIRQLGANPTEGERAFLVELQGSISQGTAINKAILDDLLEVQRAQFRRGQWLARNPGATIDDLLLIEDDSAFSGRKAAPVERWVRDEQGNLVKQQ